MNKNDLRFIKTEGNLKQALLVLLRDRCIDKITVREICELAKCSRNTFYLHYEVKEDLYKAIVEEVLDNLAAAFIPIVDKAELITHDTHRDYVANIIKQITKNRDSLFVLIKKDQGSFFKLFNSTIRESIFHSSRLLSDHSNTDTYRLQTAYLSSALTGFIFEWTQSPDMTDREAKAILEDIHIPTMKTIKKALL